MSTHKLSSMILVAAVVLVANGAMADTFGTGDNVFNIDFVPISGATNPSSGIPAGSGFTFTGVSHDYRMGTYEITNDQWNRFKNNLGVPVTGNPSTAYDNSSSSTGASVPTNYVSWYEAAQFVNWLNTSTGHQAAYNFTGTQGTSDYTLATWSPGLYRNENAMYFLPNEDEWVKAAYWNGTSLQTYASIGDVTPTQAGWNYGQTGTHTGPWAVGSGSQELNDTYDMMGNVSEWSETWLFSVGYDRYVDRGGAYNSALSVLASSTRPSLTPEIEGVSVGFRVASVPEPISMVMLGCLGAGMVAARKLRRQRS